VFLDYYVLRTADISQPNDNRFSYRKFILDEYSYVVVTKFVTNLGTPNTGSAFESC